ncbi:MAG: I78 family peptidase inhibitor [Hyphomonadaceae bacterium]
MMRSAIALMAMLLAGCAEQPQTYRDLDRISRDYQREYNAGSRQAVADTCRMAEYQSFIGRDGASIDQASLPPRARVVCFGCAVTMDHVPERLNLRLGADGKVASLGCG